MDSSSAHCFIGLTVKHKPNQSESDTNFVKLSAHRHLSNAGLSCDFLCFDIFEERAKLKFRMFMKRKMAHSLGSLSSLSHHHSNHSQSIGVEVLTLATHR